MDDQVEPAVVTSTLVARPRCSVFAGGVGAVIGVTSAAVGVGHGRDLSAGVVDGGGRRVALRLVADLSSPAVVAGGHTRGGVVRGLRRHHSCLTSSSVVRRGLLRVRSRTSQAGDRGLACLSTTVEQEARRTGASDGTRGLGDDLRGQQIVVAGCSGRRQRRAARRSSGWRDLAGQATPLRLRTTLGSSRVRCCRVVDGPRGAHIGAVGVRLATVDDTAFGVVPGHLDDITGHVVAWAGRVGVGDRLARPGREPNRRRRRQLLRCTPSAHGRSAPRFLLPGRRRQW